MAKIIQYLLRKLANLTVLRYKPTIVAVTGSVGKTSAKTAIAAVLGSEHNVRSTRGNFNGEMGVPLTILGEWRKDDLKLISRDTPAGKYFLRKIFFFIKVLAIASWHLLKRVEYPEVLVLEYGIDRPGDMSRLLQIARPNIAVLTAIGDTPAHVEFFKDADDVAREKGKLAEAVPATGFVVFNADDDRIMRLRPKIRGQLTTFGSAKDATVIISGFENRAEGEVPVGVTFKLENAGSFVPVRLDGSFGRSNSYASGAAACVGLIFGMNLVSISGALETYYRPAPHRMELVPGVKETWIIDDSYNAGPLSMRSALETLKDLPAKRKIAILGDMLEIGDYAVEAHQHIGTLAGKIADVLITVGERGHIIAEGARAAGTAKKSIMEFDTYADALSPIQTLVSHGDLILVKASHAVRLDKIVAELRSFDTAA